MSYDKTTYSRYKCSIHYETDKAIMLRFDTEDKESGKTIIDLKWFPKSVFKLDSDMKTIYLADWFVEKNNLQISKFKY